jgi:hypothetical protein
VRSDGTRFGYSQKRWDNAVDSGVKTLIGVARDKGVISYTELCRRIFDDTEVEIVPGEYALPFLLGDISDQALDQYSVALTTLVTYKDSTDAGQGLYALAVEHGLLPKNPTELQKEEFRTQQVNAAYERWQRPKRRPGERYGLH